MNHYIYTRTCIRYQIFEPVKECCYHVWIYVLQKTEAEPCPQQESSFSVFIWPQNVVTSSATFACTTDVSILSMGGQSLLCMVCPWWHIEQGLCLVIAAMLPHISTHMLPCWKAVNTCIEAQEMEHSTSYYAERLCRGRFNIPACTRKKDYLLLEWKVSRKLNIL